MSYEIVEEAGLTVVGIYTLASNAEPQKIGDLWRRFHAMGNGADISGRLSNDHICVYCEYEGDWTMPFTVVIGCAVAHDAEVPQGMKKIAIEAGKFAVYHPQGELPQAVFDAWAEVWRTPFDRRYQADYDVYGANGATVHVGVA
jgi:predicted transcriptional regulator YdeE